MSFNWLRGSDPILLAAATLLAVATAASVHGAEPFVSWYYSFAWFSLLVLLDALVARLGGAGAPGRFLLLGRPAHLACLLGWSIVAWLFFELLNFRLVNWYYVFVPEEPLVRWAGTLLAFSTVLPAVLVAEATLNGLGVARHAQSPRLRITEPRLRGLERTGWAMLALAMLWPGFFFALVWIAVTLILEPRNYRRDAACSLLGDLERGKPGRILRLLLGGLCLGLFWELFNMPARTKWIYTVPGFEELKLFEMPLPGFLGFPPFALECFVIWQMLLLAGLAVPRFGHPWPARGSTRVGFALAAALFSTAVIAGMERWTISSTTPDLADLPELPAAELEQAGYDAFTLAQSASREVAGELGVEPRDAERWIEAARLATLRGIGAQNAAWLARVDIASIEELAAAQPDELAEALEEAGKLRVVERRTRVWVRAASEARP